MKRGKDEEKIMGPMFPRLHVNDTEKGGPRAPPRNKMALYEQLSIPSQRSNHVMMQRSSNNNAPNSVPPSNQGGGGMILSRQVRPRYPSEKQYSQYSELSTPPPHVVEQRKQLDEDDCSVPVFIQPVPTEFDNYSNNTNTYKPSLSNSSYVHPSLKFQQAKETSKFERSMQQQTVSSEDLPSENENIAHDLSNDTGSGEDGSCGPPQTGNLERGDSVSETSILDTVSSPDITPDDVVGIIGQKHFWKARRAIVNQQRIFAVQVFELHRLMKVQKLISASPHLVLEDSAFFDKPVVKPLPSKKRTLDYSIKVISNDPKKKRGSENPSLEKEVSAENTVDKASLSSPQNRVSPPSLNGPPPPPCFSHPQTHQWLVPVMSPTEGLVYKPYPGSCGPPPIGNFPTPPMYGIPPPPHQYPMSSFPPFGPHGYFSPYAMPIMTTPTFSGSSVDQTNPPHVPTPTVPIQKDMAVRNGLNSNAGEETEVQGSSVSCPSERETSRQGSNGRRNMLPLFPTAPAKDVGPEVPVAEKPSRVIKVVPHNSMTASESAARIFRSIQEERKQFDAV